MKNFDLYKFIKSRKFGLIAAILSVLVQAFHSWYAFHVISSIRGTFPGMLQAVLFAIVVDFAILFYTLRGRRDVVLYAALSLFVINSYYYITHLGFTWDLLFAEFLSMLLPVTQYYYSEEIHKEDPTDEVDKEKRALRSDIEHAMGLIENREGQILMLKDVIDAGKKENAKLCERIDEERAAVRQAQRSNQEFVMNYDMTVAQRDQALNSNSTLSHALGLRAAEIHELKKRLGEIPADEEIDAAMEALKLDQDLDKSLLNITAEPSSEVKESQGYNPIRSDGPVVK